MKMVQAQYVALLSLLLPLVPTIEVKLPQSDHNKLDGEDDRDGDGSGDQGVEKADKFRRSITRQDGEPAAQLTQRIKIVQGKRFIIFVNMTLCWIQPHKFKPRQCILR